MVAQTATATSMNGVVTNDKQHKSKNQLRREKAKQKKAQHPASVRSSCYDIFPLPSRTELAYIIYLQESNGELKVKPEPGNEPVQNVEYVSEQLDVKGQALEAFSDVFARFQLPPDALTVRVSIFYVQASGFERRFHLGSQDRNQQRRDNLF
jgi:splicing factor 3B subunit 2